MPGGSLLNSGDMADYGGGGGSGGGLTFPVVVTCLMAASGGLIFGYDIGISGALEMDRIRSIAYFAIACGLGVLFSENFSECLIPWFSFFLLLLKSLHTYRVGFDLIYHSF